MFRFISCLNALAARFCLCFSSRWSTECPVPLVQLCQWCCFDHQSLMNRLLDFDAGSTHVTAATLGGENFISGPRRDRERYCCRHYQSMLELSSLAVKLWNEAVSKLDEDQQRPRPGPSRLQLCLPWGIRYRTEEEHWHSKDYRSYYILVDQILVAVLQSD